MKIKSRSNITIIVISIIFFVCCNFSFQASNLETDSDFNSSPRFNPRDKEDFTLGQILPISEPVFGMNFNIADTSHPDIAVENNKIYVVWFDCSNTDGAGSDRDIFFRYYDGKAWSSIQVISEPISGQDNNNEDSWWPRIAVENGRIYVVWHDSSNYKDSGNDMDIFYRTNLTGKGWEPIQVISEPVFGKDYNTGGSSHPSIAVENGAVYVVWTDNNNTNGAGTGADLFYRRKLEGSNWEPVQVISEPIPGQNFYTGNSNKGKIDVEQGKIYVVWNGNNNTHGSVTDPDNDSEVFFLCNLTGKKWESVQVISEPVVGLDLNTKESYKSTLAVEDGNIYVAWSDFNDTNGAGEDEDTFLRCYRSGLGWEPVVVISEPVFGQDFNTGESFGPGDDLGGIAVENGNIYIAWIDNNETDNSGWDRDIHYRCYLNDRGWEPIFVISEPIMGFDNDVVHDFKCNIAVFQGKSHFVWVSRGGNISGAGDDKDIGYRWIQAPISPLFLRAPKVTPILGNTSTEFNFTVKYCHLNNSPPTGVKVIINSIEYSMLEVDPADVNYTNGKEYFFKIKNLDIGDHTYSFWASNGTKTTTTSPENFPKIINTPPWIVTQNNLTAIEDTYYEVNYEFKDIDLENIRQPCFWKFSTNASWLKFISNHGTLFGTPTNDDVGNYWVNIIIDDTNETDRTNFTLTVIDVNDNPVIKTNNIEQIFEDEFYEVEYSATDIDSPIKNQIWSLDTNASSWLNFDTTSGVLNGTPTNDDVGDLWVNVSVTDAEGGTDFTNFTLTVVNVNDPPVITTDDLTFLRLGDSYKVDYAATDIDSPESDWIWSLKTNASWLSLNSSIGVLSGTPEFHDIGWYDVNISVDDGDGGSDWHEFELSVLNRIRNFPPLITTTDIEIAMVDEYYEVDYNATDDYTPSDHLIWYLETNASWLSIDIITGALNGTPTEDNIGWFWVNILVTDGEAGWAHHNFTLRVTKEPGIKNNAPELSNPKMSPEKGSTKTEFTFSVHYYDADSDIPAFIRLVTDVGTYEMLLKSGEAADGTYECIITLPEGEHNYYFTASDGLNTVNTQRFLTPSIEKTKQVKGELGSVGFILIAIFVILIVLIFLFLIFLHKKKKQKSETKQELSPTLPTPVISAPVDTQTMQISPYVPIYPVTIQAPPQTVQPPSDAAPTITPSVIPTTSTSPPTQSIQPVQPVALEQPLQHVIEEENKVQENE